MAAELEYGSHTLGIVPVEYGSHTLSMVEVKVEVEYGYGAGGARQSGCLKLDHKPMTRTAVEIWMKMSTRTKTSSIRGDATLN